MQKIGIRLSVIVGIVIIVIGGSWIFDRSGLVSSWIENSSGSLVERYQTLPEESPRIGESNLIRTYMQDGVTEHTAHIIHTQQSLVSDFLWIRNIQQVGKFVLRDSVPGLFGMIDNLTALSPARAYPYTFVQYVGPQQAPTGEQPSDIEKQTRQQTIDL
ncbi:MAG: hypothetical protein H6766_00465 [Candidatus Peribacteria bacterium]|nr:MAG: hypothetical protein H6766_00465 [Candidatus Peribacteria bacterium]